MEIQRVAWKRNIEGGFQVMQLADLLSQKGLPHVPARPQRLDFHMLVLFNSGVGIHMIDFANHECQAGTLVHVGPDQVHSFHHHCDVQAWMLVFRPDVLTRDFYGPDSGVSYFPSEYVWPVATVLNDADRQFGNELFELLNSQQLEPGEWRRADVARNLMLTIASFSYNVAVDNSNHSKPVMPDPLFLAFMADLQRAFATHREAKWFSDRLGCSYRTLCRVCEISSGKSPKELIDERVLTEARRLLAYSRDPVYLVADQLGFTESTNFVKYFQRISGETPEAFRKKWQTRSDTNARTSS